MNPRGACARNGLRDLCGGQQPPVLPRRPRRAIIGLPTVAIPSEPQQPIFVRADATTYDATCDYCVHEKNSPFTRDRGWAWGEGRADVRVTGEIAPDVDRLWVKCPYGHDHLVLREGTAGAQGFLGSGG